MANVTLSPTQAAYVYSSGAASADRLRIGRQSGGTYAETYMKFNWSAIMGAKIHSAVLRMYSFNGGDEFGSNSISSAGYIITTNWAADVVFASRPSLGTTAYGTMTNSGYEKWYEWDVKTLLQAIANGTTNYGVGVKQTNTTNSTAKAFYKAGNAPQLVIDYTGGVYYYNGSAFIPCDVYVGATPYDIQVF